MRRPLLASLGAALISLMLLFGFSAWLFSRNMGQARTKSEDRMSALALYIAEHIREDVFSYPFESKPEYFPAHYADQQSRWLERLTHATGLERAVITDSSGMVYVSSHKLIANGDDIFPYLLDTALFRQASRENQPRFTPLEDIDGVHFQSLYFPFALQERRHMLVLESDQNFIAYVEQFRNYLWLASLFLLALFALLTGGLVGLDRKFQAALTVSRRNERLAFLGRTSAELAHELKNPLAIIKASVDVLRKKLDPDRQEPAFGYLSEETMRLSRLIGNILGFSKDRALEAKPFQPRGALSELQEAHRMDFPGMEWSIDLPADLLLVGDRDAFRQVADNLARNAAVAMNGQGTFSVTFEPEGGGKAGGALLFKDSGPGLPKGLQGRGLQGRGLQSKGLQSNLFEPFVSGSKTGTGLGLAIVKSLCERLGWTIVLLADAARDGRPTCFALKFPAGGIAKGLKSTKIPEP